MLAARRFPGEHPVPRAGGCGCWHDHASEYRSEIFYRSDEQRQIAEETIADVDASGLWPGKVVTEISETVPFWVAEAEHQDYLQRYPNGYTCHFPRPEWKLPSRETAV